MKKSLKNKIIEKLFDNANATIFIWNNDASWSVKYVSKNVSKIFGYKAKDFLKGKISYAECIHKDFLHIVKDEMNLCSKSKSEFFEHKPYKIIIKDKKEKWVLDQTVIDRDKRGEIIQYIGYVSDVTELMNLNAKNEKYQKQINFLNERFKNMFTNHDAMMLLVDPSDGKIIDANKSAQEFYGYSSKEFLNLNIRDVNTGHKETIAKIKDKALSSQKNNFIVEHKKKSGEKIIVETKISPIETEQGTLLFSIIEDITKEQENEKKLAKVLKQLQDAQKIAKLGIWELDIASQKLEWSDEAYNIFEIEKNESSPTYEAFLNLAHPDDKEKLHKSYIDSLKTKKPYSITHRIVTQDGSIKHVSEQCYTLFDDAGNPITSYGTIQDITELSQLNSKINQEKNRYKSLLELSSDGVFIINNNLELVEYSQVSREMLGYSDEEMLSLRVPDWDVKHKDDELKKLLSLITKESSIFETIHKRKDGSTYNASITAVIIEIEGEGFIYASVRDITDEHKLQKQMTYEKNFISSIIDSANAIIAVINSDGVMIKLNNYGEEFTGYTQEEIASEPYIWKALLPLEIQDRVSSIIENAKHGEIVKSYQNVWVSKSGEKRMFEWSNTLVNKDDGSMDYVATIGIDITQKEEHKKLFETIFNTSKDGLAILDMNSKFLEFNAAYLEMTGFSREELLTKRCIDMSVPQDTPKAIEAMRQVIKHGHVDNFEKTCIVKDGKRITINMSMAMMPDKKSFLINTKDITQRKAEQDELKRTKELAEKANKSKSEFLANMSHEIRTPLNGMIGLTKLVLDTELNETQKEYLQKSLSSSKILLSVISDILDYSKIEANKIEVLQDNFVLEDVMQNLSDMFSYQAYEKDLDYIFTIDPKIPNTLVGDQVRFTQVLTNLIGNAIKFTQEGHINVHLELKNIDDESVSVECLVQDTGIGISQEKQKKLFRAFEQGDSSTTKKYGGTGLGLMISKKLVELMGSEIWLKSELNVGSTLGFTLKFKFVKDELMSLEKISQFKEASFLFVDDSEIEREYMSNIFTSWGITLQTAADGEDAYEKIKNTHFDYVLVDWKMPKLDGLELLQRLQRDDLSIKNILLVTAHKKEALLAQAQEDGIIINKILNKPYTPSTLYETLFSEKYQSSKVQKNSDKKFKLINSHTALLVEDNETNQLVATRLLENIGFVVELANNGEEALHKAQNNSYDIIFMDIHMPVMNGYTSSLRIREFDTTTPIIALSAAVMKQDKDLSLESKMDGHLSKPIDMSEVEKILRKYFEIEYVKEKVTKENLAVSIEGIDILGLKKELDIDEDATFRYYKNFFKNYTQESLKYDRTSTEMKDFIHKLKGTSGNLKMRTLYKLCIDLEKDLNNDKLFETFFIELQYTLKEIEEKIIPLTETKAISMTTQELKTLIDAVVTKFESYELVIDEDIEQIILVLKDKASQDKLETMQKYYTKNETELLCELLKDIKKSV